MFSGQTLPLLKTWPHRLLTSSMMVKMSAVSLLFLVFLPLEDDLLLILKRLICFILKSDDLIRLLLDF